MQEQQVAAFLDCCRSALTHLDLTVSVLVTGSFARGDYQVGPDGTIRSVPDLIPVIADATAARHLRERLDAELNPVSSEYGTAIHANITTRQAFIDAAASRYAETAADSSSWLRDDFGLSGHSSESPPHPGWAWQPVSYYTAKHWATGDGRSLSKAIHYAQRAGLATKTGAPEELVLALRARPAEEQLASTLRLLSGRLADEDPETTFRHVRDAVFLENQGLAFADSHIAVTAHD